MIPLYVFCIIKHYKFGQSKKTKGYYNAKVKKVVNITVFFSMCVISALLFFGSTSNGVNFIRHRNPVFGMVGQGAVDVMTPNTPPVILHEPRWSQFLHTLFGEYGQHRMRFDGILKTPFTI